MSTKKVMKKRNRNTLTFYEKIAVIRHHETNQLSRNNLARMFQCCTTQIRRVLERKDELLAQWEAMDDNNSSLAVEEMAKKRRDFEMKAAGFILHQWVERCRELQLNMVINDATLKMTAIKMATVLNISCFNPTARWIEKFRLKFKYKDEDLAKPRNVDDPPGMLSVEDIIIEFKNFLPSFMRQEISNITSDSIEEDVQMPETKEKQNENLDEKQADADDADADADIGSNYCGGEDVSSVEDGGCSSEEVSVENILRNLSEIQQFLLSNRDFKGMALVASLENHIDERYVAMMEEMADREEDEVVIFIE